MTAPSGERTTWLPQLPSLPPARNLGCPPCSASVPLSHRRCRWYIVRRKFLCHFICSGFESLSPGAGSGGSTFRKPLVPWVGIRSYLLHRLAKICCNAQAVLRHARKVRQVQQTGWTIQRQERNACGGPLDWPSPDFFLGLGLGLFAPSCATSRGSIWASDPLFHRASETRASPTSDQSAKPGSGAWASQRSAASSRQPGGRDYLPQRTL